MRHEDERSWKNWVPGQRVLVRVRNQDVPATIGNHKLTTSKSQVHVFVELDKKPEGFRGDRYIPIRSRKISEERL